ncbi:MAG: transcriptional coactivator p15/PC4 family protein [Nitrospinae bacterium]|nr:transcriptional coactivator p15/PC4 family protein [Nitrospinota bacterium]
MDKPVYTFRKNHNETVRASIRKHQGREFIDLRVWAEKETGHCEFVPTKKGLMLSVYVLPELKKAVLALEREVSRLGLLETKET